MSKITELQEKYPKLNVEKLSNLDHTKTKKFLPWLCKQKLPKEDNKIKSILERFEKNISKLEVKDINQYKSWKELEKVVEPLVSISEIKSLGSEQIFKNDKSEIIWLKNADAAKYYSAGTKWCISNKNGWFQSIENTNIYILNIEFDLGNFSYKRKVAVCIPLDSDYDYPTIYDEKDTYFEIEGNYIYNDTGSCDEIELPPYYPIINEQVSEKSKQILLSLVKKCSDHSEHNMIYDSIVPRLKKIFKNISSDISLDINFNYLVKMLKIYLEENISIHEYLKRQTFINKNKETVWFLNEFFNSNEYKKFAVANLEFVKDSNSKLEPFKLEYDKKIKEMKELEERKRKLAKEKERKAKENEIKKYLSQNQDFLNKITKTVNKKKK